ncbi:MAG: acetyl-CoA synthetase [Deltaproteobacteria bacterium]|nr:MAG: acetyl-CoA synthetase [Deltaproteobacteria bacterium]
MLTDEMKRILEDARKDGWVLEPGAKTIFRESGLPVPRFKWATALEEALNFAREIGYPVVAKVVSPEVVHKSDVGGVIVGIRSEEELRSAYERLKGISGFRGILVDETASGTELIMGAKNDAQFGPVVLLGMGGTGVEVYNDVAIRMAPLKESDVEDMLRCLKGYKILAGYRGQPAINFEELTGTVISFSELIMDLEPFFESIDINPLMCSPERCVIADARIILKK